MEKKLNAMAKRLEDFNGSKLCKCDVIDIKRLIETKPKTVTKLIDTGKGKEKVEKECKKRKSR